MISNPVSVATSRWFPFAAAKRRFAPIAATKTIVVNPLPWAQSNGLQKRLLLSLYPKPLKWTKNMLLFSFFALLVITFFVSLFLYEKSRVATIVTRLIFSAIAGSGTGLLISFSIINILSRNLSDGASAGRTGEAFGLLLIFPIVWVPSTIIISILVYILSGRVLRLFFNKKIKT